MGNTNILGMEIDAENSESWYDNHQEIRNVVDLLSARTNAILVDPAFTPGNLGKLLGSVTDRRHFPTIQEGIDAAKSSSYVSRKKVICSPGSFSENLVLDGTVAVSGMFKPQFEALGGGLGTTIAGNAAVALPVITFNPTGTLSDSLALSNLVLSNAYNQNNAVEITEAMILDITKPVTYTAKAYVGMMDCQVRMQTSGAHNKWSYGIKGAGFARLVMENTKIKAWGYAGGEHDGGIVDIISLTGDSGNEKDFSFYAVDSQFYSLYEGSGLDGATIFNIDDGVIGVVGRCGWDPDGNAMLLYKGAAGTNYISGLEGDSQLENGNTPGVCLSWI